MAAAQALVEATLAALKKAPTSLADATLGLGGLVFMFLRGLGVMFLRFGVYVFEVWGLCF